jgi:hypothetical protein
MHSSCKHRSDRFLRSLVIYVYVDFYKSISMNAQ